MASSNLDGVRQAAPRSEVLDWLYCTNPAVKHAASRKLYQPGSNTWALEADVFKDWTTTPGRVLWLHGIPGAGKTILCSTLIDHVQGLCKAQSGAHLAYYYFDSGDPSNQNPGRVFRCLLWQLTRQHDVVSSPVLDLYASCDKGYGTGYHEDRKEVSDDQLASTLFEVLRGDRQPFIILDGLDGCAEEERSRFFDVLLKHLGRASCKVNFLITSRKQPDIEERMGEVPSSKLHVMPIFTRDVTTDIRLYVAAQLATQRATRDWNDETLEKEVEDTISEQADGRFRWAYFQLESINKCNQIQSVRETLKCLPTTLYATYDRILASIPDEAAGIALAALTMLTYSVRPLTLKELADAVAIDCQRGAFDAGEDYLTRCREVLEMCGSLLTLPKQKNTGMSRRSSAERKIIEARRMQLVGYQAQIGRRHRSHDTGLGIVEFAHFTVKEYMVLGRPGGNANLERFSFSATQAHRSIAERCLTYLLIFSEGKRLVDIHLASFPFLAYAAQNWAEHWRRQLGNGENQGLVSDLLRRLFDTEQEPNNFLNLLAICPPDHRVLPGGKRVVSAENGQEASLDALPQPLHYAGHLGLPELCQWLILEKGCDVNSSRGAFGQPLHVAAGLGHVNAVTVFLDHGADPNSAAGPCGYPLQAAALGGHVETARVLLERGADVNGKGGSCGTALIAACHVGHAKVTQLLLDNGADIEAESARRGRALANAVASGNDATVQLLLRKRPQLNYRCESSPLYWAAQKGNLDLVKTLVAAGADVNHRSSLWQTPLMGACRGRGKAKWKGVEEAMESRHLEVARYLIQSGADVDQHDHHNGDALQTAVDATAAGNVEGNNIDLVTLLLEAGADINQRGGPHRSAMQAAVSRGNMAAAHALLDRGVEVNDEIFLIAVKERRKSIIQRLLSTGVNANARNEHGTALSLAILADDQETTDALLRDPTIDVNAVAGNRGNITALSQAIAKKSFVLVQRLLELGANVRAPSGDDNTCLLHAVRSGDRNIIELLIASGADVNAGQPLAVACERGTEELVRYLLDQGADVNARASGLAPDALQQAAGFTFTRDSNIVKLLLDRGADVKAPEGRYGSCLESAITARRPDITRLLLDAGANVNFSRPLKDLDQHGEGLGLGGPLSAAIAHPQPGLLAELIERGADVNFRGLPSSAESVSHSSRGVSIFSGAPLMQAVKLKQVDVVQVLLKNGANVNQVSDGDGDGCALVSAILNRHNPFVTGMVQRLLAAGADVNLQGGYYGCPLAAAVAERDLDLVAKLLDLGADVNAPAAEHGSPLMIAIREGDLDVFRLLLARGANVDAIYEAREESEHTMSIPIGLRIRRTKVAANGYAIDEGQGGSALEVAGGRHAHTMFNELLARGVDVTANGSAAVVACAGAGNTTGLLALLDRGANMHIQQGVPGKALHEAARCLHIGTVKVLLERGVDVNSFGGVHGNALMAALGYRGRLEDGLGPMIDLLLDAGTSPNSPPSEEYTSLLHAAICEWKLDLARKLLDKGADANAHDPRFGTPLTAASSVGDVTLMKRLIEMGADPSLAGNEHGSALQAAARGGRLSAARYLLTLPTVNINQCSGKWGFALHAACHSGRDDDVVRLLLANGADVNVRGGQYGTALQAAAAGGQLEAVKLLLQHGADPLAAGGKFGSALEAALGGTQPHYHVANYLRRHLAKVEAQGAPAEGVRT